MKTFHDQIKISFMVDGSFCVWDMGDDIGVIGTVSKGRKSTRGVYVYSKKLEKLVGGEVTAETRTVYNLSLEDFNYLLKEGFGFSLKGKMRFWR